MNDVADMRARADGSYLISGALTFDTVPQMYAYSNKLFERHDADALTLDLQGVQRTDSAGLALLMDWVRSARRHNKAIRFQNIPTQMLAIARLSGVEDLLV